MRYQAPLTPAQAEQLGNDVGTIIGFAANAISHLRGTTSAEDLMTSLSSPAAIEVTAARYLRALEEGLPPGEAAARAGTALIHDWANAALDARDRLSQQQTGQTNEASQ